MKDLSVFSLKFCFFIKASLKKAIMDLCSLISFVLAIYNLKNIFEKFLSLSNLAKAQIFCNNKLTKIIIVG